MEKEQILNEINLKFKVLKALNIVNVSKPHPYCISEKHLKLNTIFNLNFLKSKMNHKSIFFITFTFITN